LTVLEKFHHVKICQPNLPN